jgi:hypothetical protein
MRSIADREPASPELALAPSRFGFRESFYGRFGVRRRLVRKPSNTALWG